MIKDDFEIQKDNTVRRLERLRELAIGIQQNPIDANEDELMRMVRIADEIDTQWRAAVAALLNESESMPLHLEMRSAHVLRRLRDLQIKTSR